MFDNIEKFNVVVSSSTEFDNLNNVVGYTHKETTYPLVGAVYLIVIILFLGLVVKIVKR